MRQRCKKCGEMKKTLFKCDRCQTKVCLNCFQFKKWLCFDCSTLEYNEKYRNELNLYEVERVMEDENLIIG